MACKTISVLGAATQQVAIPSRLPQTQSDWQTFVQQLNTLFSQLSTTARRPAATSVPIQYATLFSSTLPPLQTTNCTVTADNSWALFGGFSYKIVVTGPNASVVCGASGFPLPIPPNENWLLSVYGKCSGASQTFKMGLQTATTTYENTVITDATATTVDRFAIPLNLVADDASQCTLRLDFPSASGETFWFDGFQYEPSVTGSINPSPFLSTNIIAGSIVAQFITVAQLSALSANMGTLTAGKIQSSDGRFTIDCTNELITITDGTNTRMQIGQVSLGIYDVKIWNGSGVLLFDAATGLQYAGNSTQVTQVINNNAGNGQLNVNPSGGVTSNLPHANQSNQTLQVISNIGGNGQLNVSPTGGVTNTLPYANHAPSITTTIVNTPDGNGSYLGHGVVFQPHIHANQIGWGHFIGDTSGNYSGNLVDGLNLRFLHGAMSGPTQNTVAGTADGNGSYLQHGVVFNPHITAGAIGFKNFLGDTSGDVTTNLVDAANKRFLHGAMSTGVQGVISSGSQVNVNPSGGVTGNLPYANHDVSVRTTLASTAGGDGSYLNPVIFNRHLANANAAGVVYTAGGTVDSLKPAQAGADVTAQNAQAMLLNPSFTNGTQGWSLSLVGGTVTNMSSGGTDNGAYLQVNIPSSMANNDYVAAQNNFLLPCVAGDQIAAVGYIKTPATGVCSGNFRIWFYTAAQTLVSLVYGPTISPGTQGWKPVRNFTAAPATSAYCFVDFLIKNNSGSATPATETWGFDSGALSIQLHSLAEVPDDATSSRYAVLAIDSNRRPLIDFTQSSHVGKTQSNIADDANAKMFRFGTLAGRPAAGTAGRIYHASDAGTNGITYRDTGSAWVEMAVGHLADINGTTDNITDGALTLRQPVSTAAANLADNGGFELWQNGLPVGWINGAALGASPAAAVTQDTSPYAGVYCVKITTDAGGYEGIVSAKYFPVTPGQAGAVSVALKSDGTHAVGAGLWFSDEAGTYKGSVFVPAVTSNSWVYQTATGSVPAGATRMYLATSGPNPGGSFSYWVDAFSAYLGTQTVNIPGGGKAFADFTDNTAGGHLGKSNWADATQMGTNIQGGTGLTDGETITFANAYSADPEIVFGDGGLTYDSTLGAVSQFQDFSASFTHSGGQTTGFTAALKISTVGGALTNHSQNFASDSVTLSIASGVIANGALTVSGNVHNSQSEINIITITLTDTTHSISWQKTVSVPAASNKPFSFAITDTSAANGTVFTLGYSSGGSDSGTPTISYQTQTAATVHTATPTGVPGVNWVAFSTS